MDALWLEEAEALVRYWRQHPPVHEVVRKLGEYFGAWEPPKDESDASFELATEADIVGSLAMFQGAMGHLGQPRH